MTSVLKKSKTTTIIEETNQSTDESSSTGGNTLDIASNKNVTPPLNNSEVPKKPMSSTWKKLKTKSDNQEKVQSVTDSSTTTTTTTTTTIASASPVANNVAAFSSLSNSAKKYQRAFDQKVVQKARDSHIKLKSVISKWSQKEKKTLEKKWKTALKGSSSSSSTIGATEEVVNTLFEKLDQVMTLSTTLEKDLDDLKRDSESVQESCNSVTESLLKLCRWEYKKLITLSNKGYSNTFRYKDDPVINTCINDSPFFS